ncbi:heat shock protein 70 family [Glomus cerebriforme]|uniref:Heat shock protein 70 family n=1 Tax=Glomus cerebriforme TaxID=658196 RepID=A0A397T0B4_9GLOM|nr:heat shock protein 70 family [Glomus cerebriforme]
MPSATDSKPVIIGLRIGQSYSSIAIINKDGRAGCIANEDGERQIPTMVAFSGEEELTGTQARVQLLSNAKNTITQFRNFIGKSYEECKSIANIGTAQLVDKDGQAAYKVEFKEEETIVTVQEVCTKYITSLKESAENFLGQPVTGTVLAVPTYFTEQQKNSLKIATEKAGLKVLQLINEPSAAALAYELGYISGQKLMTANEYDDRVDVIVDLGSDSLDVSVMSVRSGMYTILGTTHDPDLGGAAFDELLAKHFANEFKRKTKIDITDNKRALVKLRNAVEITKKTLSSNSTAPCSVESLAEGIDFHGNINRTRFEIMANKLFSKNLEIISEALKKNDLEPQSIDEVILVGGASRIPKLQSKIREMFVNPSTLIRQDFEPEEVVAYGCAFQGSLLSNFADKIINDSINTSITSTPHLLKSIGIVNDKQEFITLIPENTPLPVRRKFTFTNYLENQKEIYITVWEGIHQHQEEEKKVEEGKNDEKDEGGEDIKLPQRPINIPDKLLAEMVLKDLPEKLINELKIDIIIEVDIHSKCIITAKEISSDKKLEIEIDGKTK